MRWCVRVLSRELKMNRLERGCEWNEVKIGIDDTIVITRILVMALEYFVIFLNSVGLTGQEREGGGG